METRIEVYQCPNGDEFKITYDNKGRVVTMLVNGDPTHPMSYRNLFDDQGNKMGFVQSDDPTYPWSWVYVYDQDGKPTHRQYGDGVCATT